MYWGSVYVISTVDDTLIKEVRIDHKPNTLSLSSDGKYLFISTRGPNNPESYLLKGPRFGKIYVMDTDVLEVIEWIWGQNQPTGLGISPDDSILAFSNFQDHTIEVYWTGLKSKSK